MPAGAVSTTRLDDLVAVARLFADVKKPGMTPGRVRQAVRRRPTAARSPRPAR